MSNNRIWEIDFLRAVAIIFMVALHLGYDLEAYADISVPYWDVIFFYVSKGVVIFMFISAISSGFSKEPVKRGLIVFAFGIGITVITYFLMPETYVRFGILHFLGLTMMMFPFLKKLDNRVLLTLAVLSAIIGLAFRQTTVNTGLFLPLGLRYNGFNSIDYYPIFPYIAATIMGVLAYKKYYYARKSIFPFYWNPKIIRWISKNSLAIYLLHQPILMGVFYLLKGSFKL